MSERFFFKGNKKILHLVPCTNYLFLMNFSFKEYTEAAFKYYRKKIHWTARTARYKSTWNVLKEGSDQKYREPLEKTEGTRSRITASKLNTLLVLNVLLWTFFILNSYSLPYPLSLYLSLHLLSDKWTCIGTRENRRENANLSYNMRGSGSKFAVKL